MNRTLAGLAAGLLALGLVAPAHADPEAAKPPKPAPVLRCAHSYAEAMAEAKDRGCVVFATLHSDG